MKLSPFPFFTSCKGIPVSSAMISATRGIQKPPWHLPMPARVRRLTPSIVRAPTGRRMAARISASVTVSQRQMILPQAGSAATAFSLSSVGKKADDYEKYFVPLKEEFEECRIPTKLEHFPSLTNNFYTEEIFKHDFYL